MNKMHMYIHVCIYELKQRDLIFTRGVQKFVRQHEMRNGVVYFPSMNANANKNNFAHLLLDLGCSGRGCEGRLRAPVSGERRRGRGGAGEHRITSPCFPRPSVSLNPL